MWGKRIYRGILSGPEQRVIRLCLPIIPDYISPDHLSLIAAFGALIAGASLLLAWLSPFFVLGFAVGLLVHWFGDSFDGAVARFRNIERPKAGFLIDRSGDILSYFVIIGCLGFSPYMSIICALLLLIGVLTNAVYGILLSMVDKKQVVGVGGLGGTEGRILILAWVILCQLTGYVNLVPPFQLLGALEVSAFILLAISVGVYARGMLKSIRANSAAEAVVEPALPENPCDLPDSNSKAANLVAFNRHLIGRPVVRTLHPVSNGSRRIRV